MTQDPAPNLNAVWIALIQTVGTVAVILATWWANRKRSERIEQKADVAATRADDAAVETVKGNAALAEVSKTVNGRNDALVVENKRLEAELAQARAVIGTRRADDVVRPS